MAKNQWESDSLLSWIALGGIFTVIYILTCLKLDLAESFAVVAGGSGLVVLLDYVRRKICKSSHTPSFVLFCQAVFPVLLAVFILRVAFFEHFRIPSGSMKPTLLEGDVILVNRSAYGVRLPFIQQRITPGAMPKRGDIVIFHHPHIQGMTLVKRLVGLPGDRIVYRDKILYINEVPQSQTVQGMDVNVKQNGQRWRVRRLIEDLHGHPHAIFLQSGEGMDMSEVVVPEGHYFMMGDNRDDSQDSRAWGPVPDSALLGRAFFIILSWDGIQKDIRWQRTGRITDLVLQDGL